MRPELPVDRVVNQILGALHRDCNVVLEAPPGAGKTTRVPPALLQATRSEVLVLEPRRIAARMAARRVAAELGEALGATVGYQVRFEEVASRQTRLRFLTEGVLTRRLLSDPQLRSVGIVVLDEFHERHLDGDLALALLRRLQVTSRPDLRLVVMSATLDAAPVLQYLQPAELIKSEGRLFPIDVSYAGYSPAPLEEQVASAVERAVETGLTGDTLVFLPGAAEIRRAARSCERIAQKADLLILPLHGDLSPEEQDRAVAPAAKRKLILSTNVAESSITIDGVTLVVDSGLARIAQDDTATGLPRLSVQRISQASAQQRTGRAGRTQPGRSVRLYSVEDFSRRPAHDVPEILRRELSQVLLDLRAIGVKDLAWFEAPPAEAVAAANELLDRLDTAAEPQRFARIPLHPRLARLVIDSPSEQACRLAALLSSGERIGTVDVLGALDAELSHRTRQIAAQLRRIVKPPARASEEQLRRAILRAFPDRVGRKQNNVQLASGKFAAIEGWRSEYLVAIDIEERRELPLPQIRVAGSIEPEWLLDLYPDRIREVDEISWNRTAERVESRNVLLYDEVIISESRSGAVDPERASELLAEKALETGIERFADPDALEETRVRMELAGIEVPDLAAVLRSLAYGLRSFAELKQAAGEGRFVQALIRSLSRDEQRRLEDLAPERIPLKNRMVKVHYARGQQPWIASRLQDFFGMRATPSIGKGRTPLLVHLLAPNQRPVQMTSDLAGFWERLYPQLRKELSRRYPKHSWPENPV